MDWLVTSAEDIKVLDEIRNGASDRAVGIIGASLVEIHLTNLLKRAFIKEKTNKDAEIMNEIFRSAGPLGPFATKIKVAYLMGMISDELYRDLTNMKEIRNKFAHHTECGSFKVPDISSRCFNFKLVDKYVADTKHGIHGSPAAFFAFEVAGAETKLKDSKERFVLSCQIFSVGLQSATVNPKPYVPSF